MTIVHSTTVVAIHRQGRLVMGGDGQVTVNNSIMKHGAVKIRSLQSGRVLAGFAGAAADAFALFERFEGKLSESGGNLARAVIELAKDWRTDKYLRRLEAMMVVGDIDNLFLLTGSGDVIQPDDGVIAIGSGGNYALAAARSLLRYGQDNMGLKQIVHSSLEIASELCPFTNNSFTIEEIPSSKGL